MKILSLLLVAWFSGPASAKDLRIGIDVLQFLSGGVELDDSFGEQDVSIVCFLGCPGVRIGYRVNPKFEAGLGFSFRSEESDEAEQSISQIGAYGRYFINGEPEIDLLKPIWFVQASLTNASTESGTQLNESEVEELAFGLRGGAEVWFSDWLSSYGAMGFTFGSGQFGSADFSSNYFVLSVGLSAWVPVKK
jgi:hypothetical protein